MLEGMDKKNSYDKFWLGEDMMTMGNMFEYSDKFAKERHGFVGEFDRIKFANVFMLSNLRSVMEVGHPGLLSEAVQDVYWRYVNVDCKGSLEQFRATTPPLILHKHQLYWIGQAYAYIHYEADITSRDLIKKLPLEEMLHFYITGHQIDFSNFYERVKDALK